MSQMERDLGTKLDWVGVDHWNTDNPHIHIILRGRTDDGQDLVISRDYIKEGMRARAQDLVTLELRPRTDLDIHCNLERQVEAERWTQLDRQLVRDGRKSGVIDLAPLPDCRADEFHALKVGRLRTLEILGLAGQVGPAQWFIGIWKEIGPGRSAPGQIFPVLEQEGCATFGPSSPPSQRSRFDPEAVL